MFRRIRSNDPSIPVGSNLREQGVNTRTNRAAITDALDALSREGRAEVREIKRRYRRERKLCRKDDEARRALKNKRELDIADSRRRTLLAQAQSFAAANGQEISPDLSDRELGRIVSRAYLPPATRMDERYSFIGHAAGAGLAIVMLIVGVCLASLSPAVEGERLEAIVGTVIFCLGAVIMYTISAIYHSLYVGPAKRVFRILDHSSIYILIAASYTPFCLLGALDGAYGSGSNLWGYVILGLEWGLGIVLIVINSIWLKKRWVVVCSVIGDVILGWSVLPFAPWVLENLGTAGFLLLLFGGISYTVGAILFPIGSRKRMVHGTAHLLYVLGTVLHFLSLCLSLLT